MNWCMGSAAFAIFEDVDEYEDMGICEKEKEEEELEQEEEEGKSKGKEESYIGRDGEDR